MICEAVVEKKLMDNILKIGGLSFTCLAFIPDAEDIKLAGMKIKANCFSD